MKKLITALFSLFLLTPSFATPVVGEAYINQLQTYYDNESTLTRVAAQAALSAKSTTISAALEVFFPAAQNRASALEKYHAAVAANGGKGLKPADLWAICSAGGLDINSQDGKNKCGYFARALRETYYDVCDDKKGPGNNYCVKDFKSIQTQMRTGTSIAKAWAKTQKKDTIVCEDKYRGSWNDDYLSCYSIVNTDAYYEFQFDDLAESGDVDTERGFREAACALAGLNFIAGGFSNSSAGSIAGANMGGGGTSWPSHCPTTGKSNPEALCAKVDAFAKEMGFSSRYSVSDGGCVFSDTNVRDASEIVNEYNGIIDNYVYSKDQSQLQAASSLDESIRMYAQRRLGATPITSFECDKAHKRYIRGILENNEDIITCRINGKRVDFVFDDLTQATALWGSQIIEGSQQGLDCRAMGGVFDGEHCAGLTQDMCAQVAQLNLAECPDCKAAYWDAEKGICMLPESKQAKDIRTQISVVTSVGTAVVGLVVTVVSGGSVLMIAAASTATVAAATSEGVKLMQDADASDWVEEMNRIQTPEAADKFLREHLEEIIGADHLVEQRRNGLDEMLSRVLGKASDDYFYELVGGCTVVTGDSDAAEVKYDTSLPDCALNPENGSNTKSTIIRIADAVQFIAGVVMLVEGLRQTINMLSTRATTIAQKIDALKQTGWIRQNGQWVNQTTGQTLATLPKGVPGWDPGVNRWRGLLYGHGTTGSFTRQADLVKWLVTTNVSRTLAQTVAGVAITATSPSEENPANVQIPDRTTDVPPVDTTPAGIPVTDIVVELPDPIPPITGNVPEKPAQPQTPPVQTVPVETDPVYTAPVETMTEQPTSVQYMPVQTTYSQPTPVDTPETSRDIKPHQVKNNGAKTALIATAAIAGTIGAGWLIGGLIGKDDDDNKTTSAPVAPQVDPELERLMQNAGGVIGVINGQSLKLIPLPTTINSYAPIVDINGKAVVVVDYRGHRLPYYMNPMTMRWEPLLGIGVNAGWFNVYPNPSQSGIAIIDSISGQLVQKLKPSVVSRYVGNYATGTRFPMAGPAAYQTINAEFPNGVVNTNTGAMSPSDQLLYNNNYQLIKQKLR